VPKTKLANCSSCKDADCRGREREGEREQKKERKREKEIKREREREREREKERKRERENQILVHLSLFGKLPRPCQNITIRQLVWAQIANM
jgi:hypothetical protein